MVAISQAEVRWGRLLPPATPEKPGLEELEAAVPPLPIDVPLPLVSPSTPPRLQVTPGACEQQGAGDGWALGSFICD